MTDVRYLTVDELIYINEALPGNDQIHKILKGKQKVRDMGLLEAAAGRPQQSVFGADAYPTLTEKAAALLHAIARNHPFADGNKRTATLAALFMLEVNGLQAAWDAAQALENIVRMAEGQMSVDDFAVWLTITPGMLHSDADANKDVARIAKLIEIHEWLLEALAAR